MHVFAFLLFVSGLALIFRRNKVSKKSDVLMGCGAILAALADAIFLFFLKYYPDKFISHLGRIGTILILSPLFFLSLFLLAIIVAKLTPKEPLASLHRVNEMPRALFISRT